MTAVRDQQGRFERRQCRRSQALSQLTALAAPAVDAGVDDGFIALPLEDYAGAYTRQCFAPTRRDRLATVLALL